MPRLILASASAARLATLRRAGLAPDVIVSGVDEEGVSAGSPASLAATLARLKAEAVLAGLPWAPQRTIVVGCDSVLELDGRAYGRPATTADAVARWHRMRGRSGILHTGHHVILRTGAERSARNAAAATVVHFADLTDAEIEAYVATGEPLEVAGSFTVDGLGGPFVTGIEGDYHNVVGLSLPLLRTMLIDLGVAWPELWSP